MLWLWQRFWVPYEIFFWIFVVPYKISHLCKNKNTILLKIYPCFLSQITIYYFPTWPGSPCIIQSMHINSKWVFRQISKVMLAVYFYLPIYYHTHFLSHRKCVRSRNFWWRLPRFGENCLVWTSLVQMIILFLEEYSQKKYDVDYLFYAVLSAVFTLN